MTQRQEEEIHGNPIWYRLNLPKFFKKPDQRNQRHLSSYQKQNTLKYSASGHEEPKSSTQNKYIKPYYFDISENEGNQTIGVIRDHHPKNISIDSRNRRVGQKSERQKLIIDDMIRSRAKMCTLSYRTVEKTPNITLNDQKTLILKSKDRSWDKMIKNRSSQSQNEIAKNFQRMKQISTESNEQKCGHHSWAMTPYMKKRIKRKTQKFTKTKNSDDLEPHQQMFKFTEAKPLHEFNQKKNTIEFRPKTRNIFTSTNKKSQCKGRFQQILNMRDRELRPWSGNRKMGLDDQF